MHAGAAIAFAAIAALAAGCDQRDSSRDPGPLRVVVTVPPLEGLARRVAPADAQITALIPPGRSEHGHELTPSDLTALGRADVVVLVGLGLEPQVEAFLARHPQPRRRVVEFAQVAGLAQSADGHDHDHDGHDHGPVDPHLWLDPALVAKLVPAIADAMAAAMNDAGGAPEQAARIRQSGESVAQEVMAADVRWAQTLAPVKGRSIVTHHAAWSRLADRYGLKVAAVIRTVEGQEPTPGEVEAAVLAIRDEGASAVFVEPQFNPDLAQRIARQAGVQVGTLDPLGEGDWFQMMDRNVEELANLLGPTSPPPAAEGGDGR